MPKPLSGPQLCAIARDVLTPELDDSEWRERIKCRIARLGYASPRSGVISAAMTRVEYALAHQGRPRAVPAVPRWI
jgi:hypothetical protein